MRRRLCDNRMVLSPLVSSGKNSLGFIRRPRGSRHNLLAGACGLPRPTPRITSCISQSGALGTSILDWAAAKGLGFSAFVSVGSLVPGVNSRTSVTANVPASVVCGLKMGPFLVERAAASRLPHEQHHPLHGVDHQTAAGRSKRARRVTSQKTRADHRRQGPGGAQRQLRVTTRHAITSNDKLSASPAPSKPRRHSVAFDDRGRGRGRAGLVEASERLQPGHQPARPAPRDRDQRWRPGSHGQRPPAATAQRATPGSRRRPTWCSRPTCHLS